MHQHSFLSSVDPLRQWKSLPSAVWAELIDGETERRRPHCLLTLGSWNECSSRWPSVTVAIKRPGEMGGELSAYCQSVSQHHCPGPDPRGQPQGWVKGDFSVGKSRLAMTQWCVIGYSRDYRLQNWIGTVKWVLSIDNLIFITFLHTYNIAATLDWMGWELIQRFTLMCQWSMVWI